MRSFLRKLGPLGPGLLMATAGGFGSQAPELIAVGMASTAVLIGLWLRAAATLAVLLAVATLTLADPAPIPAAVCGLGAAGYLVLRHAGTITAPTCIAVAGFSFAGLVATAFPVSVPWLALLAPFVVFGLYAVATYPFLGVKR